MITNLKININRIVKFVLLATIIGTLSTPALAYDVQSLDGIKVWFGDSAFETKIEANGELDANGVVNLGDGGDAVTINGSTVGVTGDTTFSNGATVSGTLDANGQVDLGDGGDTVTINGTSVGVTGPTTVTGTLGVTGDYSSTSGSITLTNGGATVGGTLDANGQVDLGDGGDTVTINGSSVGVTGDATFNNGATVTGTLDANGQVDLGDGGDAVNINGTAVGITGPTTVTGTFGISGALSDTDGNLEINDSVEVTGSIDATVDMDAPILRINGTDITTMFAAAGAADDDIAIDQLDLGGSQALRRAASGLLKSTSLGIGATEGAATAFNLSTLDGDSYLDPATPANTNSVVITKLILGGIGSGLVLDLTEYAHDGATTSEVQACYAGSCTAVPADNTETTIISIGGGAITVNMKFNGAGDTGRGSLIVYGGLAGSHNMDAHGFIADLSAI